MLSVSRLPIFSASVLACIWVSQAHGEPLALEKTPLNPGTVSEFVWPGLPHPLLISLPENFDPAGVRKPLPLLFWYHGTHGHPTIDFARRHTGGKNWIIVGMTYLESGQFQYSPEKLKKEMAVYQAVRIALSQRLPVNGGRTFVGGFSKGGWVSALIIEKDPTIAGGTVLGAGVFDRPGEEKIPGNAGRPKSVFIGVGENDGNFGMSHKAASHFRELAATVTHEVWPNLAHSAPKHSEYLQQWLRIEGANLPDRVADSTGSDRSSDPVQSEASAWFTSELGRIRDDETSAPFEQFLALERLAAAPFAKLASETSRQGAREFRARISARPEMNSEMEARRRFQKILDLESRDLLLETIIDAHRGYASLAEAFPETRYGRKALLSEERTGKLISGAGKRTP